MRGRKRLRILVRTMFAVLLLAGGLATSASAKDGNVGLPAKLDVQGLRV